MTRRYLAVLAIVAGVLVVVSIILMATARGGVFGSFGHPPFGNSPPVSPPQAWPIMIAGMVLGGLGLVAFLVVIVLAVVQATGPRSER